MPAWRSEQEPKVVGLFRKNLNSYVAWLDRELGLKSVLLLFLARELGEPLLNQDALYQIG